MRVFITLWAFCIGSFFHFSHSDRCIIETICIFLVTNIQHLLMCLFATLLFVKIFSSNFFQFYEIELLIQAVCQITTNTFCWPVAWLFMFLTVSFEMHNFKIFMKSSVSIFFSFLCRNLCLTWDYKDCSPIFF